MKNIFYVYAYIRDDSTPYYIGKGSGNRAYNKTHRSMPNNQNQILFIKTNLLESEALALEKELISKYGRKDLGTGILINLTDGGEGISNPSENTRLKMSEAKRNESNETRIKRSVSAKNRKRSPTADETKVKISIANTGKTRSAEAKQKMAEAKLGKKRSPESVAKSTAGLTGKKKPLGVCPHCGLKGGISAMTRWHFNNCKSREIKN